MQASGLDKEFSDEPVPEVVFRRVPFYGWELDGSPPAPHQRSQAEQEQ